MKSTRRSRRHRNPKVQEKQDKAFFGKGRKKAVPDNQATAFFQPKGEGLTIGQPGDQYEQEADAMADSVVNRSSRQPLVQAKEISSLQRAPAMEEEKLSTAEQRMRKDQEIQEKPDLQAMEGPSPDEEKEPDLMKMNQAPEQKEEMARRQPAETEEETVAPKTAPEAEEEMAQRQVEPEEEIQESPESETVEEEEMAQTKTESAARPRTTSPELASRIKASQGKGRPLPEQTRTEMEQSFGVDFRAVNIHTDKGAEEMNKDLKAQAFTKGKDVYFNSGKYQPDTSAGKHLLAHELTHVVQQNEDTSSKSLDKKRVRRTGTEMDLLKKPGSIGNRIQRIDEPGTIGKDQLEAQEARRVISIMRPRMRRAVAELKKHVATDRFARYTLPVLEGLGEKLSFKSKTGQLYDGGFVDLRIPGRKKGFAFRLVLDDKIDPKADGYFQENTNKGYIGLNLRATAEKDKDTTGSSKRHLLQLDESSLASLIYHEMIHFFSYLARSEKKGLPFSETELYMLRLGYVKRKPKHLKSDLRIIRKHLKLIIRAVNNFRRMEGKAEVPNNSIKEYAVFLGEEAMVRGITAYMDRSLFKHIKIRVPGRPEAAQKLEEEAIRARGGAAANYLFDHGALLNTKDRDHILGKSTAQKKGDNDSLKARRAFRMLGLILGEIAYWHYYFLKGPKR